MKRLALGVCCTAALFGCSKTNDTAASKQVQGDFAVTGSLSSVVVAAPGKHAAGKSALQAGSSGNTITHVMAISPASGNPERFVAEVNADKSFSLSIESGKPYVLVFVAQNGTLMGPDMIAGILKLDNTIGLDTLAPTGPGSTDLGAVTVDGAAQQATPASFNLTDLGLTTDEATFLGTIDDLTLRAANPDVDGNGVIDALEDKHYSQDWHIRANITNGAGGSTPTFADIANKYLAASGGSVVTLDFNLGSAYAVYSDTFSTAACASGGATLATGCAFGIVDATGADVTSSWVNTTYSGGTYGGNHQWGPDYLLGAASGQDLPGSLTAAVTMKYTVETGKTLTFSNVKTRSKTTLTQDGTIIPFLKINTTGSSATGTITSIDYQWMKLASGAWTLASDHEINLIVGDNGGFATFYTTKNSSTQEGVSFTIPKTSATGNIPWTTSGVMVIGNTVLDLTTMTPDSFCSSAVSYDDKLGLRIFAGAVNPTTGSPCN